MPDNLVEVTDPDILKQLNTPQSTEVTDPNILAQLNAPQGQASPPTFWNKLMQTWPARMAQGIYSGATLPGDVYAGKTQVDPSNPEFMGRVTSLASVAPVSTLPSVVTAAPSVKQLISEGVRQREEAVGSGLIFPSDKVQQGIENIRSELPGAKYATKTHDVLDDFQTKVDSGQPITISDLHDVRGNLKSVQFNSARSSGETAATDLMASTTAKHGIDDIMRGTPEGDQYIAANANIAAGKMSEGLDKRLFRSELRASSAASGQNLGNTIRQQVASMLLGKEGRTLPDFAKEQATQLVQGTGPENYMRLWGNRLGGGQGLGWQTAAGIGGVLGFLGSGGSPTITGTAALAGPIIGGLLKHGATELAVNHLDALSQALRANSPLGQLVNRGGISREGIAPLAKSAFIRALASPDVYQFPQGQ